MTIFRRPKLSIRGQHDLKILGQAAPSMEAHSAALNSTAGYAHCSVEIMDHGMPHEVPYARLEKVGPYSNWLNMHELSLATTYQRSDGQWIKEYQQLEKKVKIEGKTAARQGYEYAMVIYSLLKQIEWIDPPDFLKGVMNVLDNSYRPRIKELVFDRFKRTITVRNLNTIHKMQCPTIVSLQENSQRLTGPPASLHLRQPGGGRCDYCYAARAGGKYVHCVDSDIPNQCHNCKVLQRPCTKTPAKQRTPAGIAMCYGRPPINGISYPIDPPAFQEFGVEEAAVEEAEEAEVQGEGTGIEQLLGGAASDNEGDDPMDESSDEEYAW